MLEQERDQAEQEKLRADLAASSLQKWRFNFNNIAIALATYNRFKLGD
ncbi:MAG: hypothetical protein WCP16_11970 [Pseudanabaena sp. ELA645]|jgi:hypothetical protein